MNANVFEYAKKQMIGMQFEPFTYLDSQKKYTWNPSAIVKALCVLTIGTPLSTLLFKLFVKSEAR